MRNQEKVVKEKRTIEATRKDLMGPSGKLGTILKFMGTQILSQNMELENYLEDPYEQEYEEIPTMDIEDVEVVSEGWIFDGLSRGMQLEIRYMEDESKLTVTYKGWRVYAEVAGDLECYAPFPEWEDLVEKLYKAAIVKKEAHKKIMKEKIKEEADKEKKSFLQKLRLIWGL